MGLFRFPHAWPSIVPPDSPLATSIALLDDRDRALEDYLADLPLGVLGYTEVTADQSGITTLADLTGLSVTVTVGSGRRIRITGSVKGYADAAADAQGELDIYEGATLLNQRDFLMGVVGNGMAWGPVIAIETPSAGSHTYKLAAQQTVGAGGITMQAAATQPAFILVEDIGRV